MSQQDASIFEFSERLTAFPVVHANGDYAQEVRRLMLERSFDCLAVPLPRSFQAEVTAAVERLPEISIVSQVSDAGDIASFVPVEPCQAVIAGLRLAQQEHLPCAFVDLETSTFESYGELAPDPYALKQMAASRFAAAMLPFVSSPPEYSQRMSRIRRMAFELHRLELDYESILFLPAIQDWPFVRDAFRERAPYAEHEKNWQRPQTYVVEPDSLYFVLGELPYVTYLYEKARREMRSDEHLSIDGVKELLLQARSRWQVEHPEQKRWVTPQLLRLCLQYLRNLTLFDGRLSPDLYNMAVAAKQVAGDSLAIQLVETAKTYPYQKEPPALRAAVVGDGIGRLGDGSELHLLSRLPGAPKIWRQLQLKPKPKPQKKQHWKQRWNPFMQCSWPPEDDRVESFNAHVREQAKALLAEDLGRSEKFTSSLKDGLDMRETLRNWHTGDLYVKETPPGRGSIEVVLFLFEDPLDESVYSWRSTWYAEHQEESTLCFCATPFRDQLVGPGVALSKYGGLLLIYPPRGVPDIWTDPRLEFAQDYLERLVAAATLHSSERNVVLVGPRPPRARWRSIARRFRKHLLYIPLSRFSGQTIERLRNFHVLNGQDVRSYAAQYVRDF